MKTADGNRTDAIMAGIILAALVAAWFWYSEAAAGPADRPPAAKPGVVLNDIGNPEQAVNAYRATLGKDADSADAQFNLGNLFERTGNKEQAEYYYRETVRKDPGHVMANYKLGLILAGEGKYQEAIARIEKAIALQPGLPGAYVHLGNIYLSLHKTDTACRQFRKALSDKADAGKVPQKIRQLCNF